ncbi:MAG: leucine--tRNA ligase [Bacilli bacterium]|jgi:leucyl-tRNA synthetase|nr:leucine--tRNA ligase [Bacilli bacterium]
MNYQKIEEKWQKKWEESGLYRFSNDSSKNKLYMLEMFSYPSGAKLHLGHWYNFGVADTWARFKRMTGYQVFHPMGFDAFGLPAENYAIKTGIHPSISTEKNIETMEHQLRKIGGSWNWDHEVVTCRPDYYKWTQWMFLKLYEHGLAYKKEAPVNFCPSCNTVLANEQVIQGECERCKTPVVHKNMSQWFFKITDYAEELLQDLEHLNWPERTKLLQKNWIGKSNGAYITFKIANSDLQFDVFTTRADTLFGCTYCVLAPEHPLVEKITAQMQKEEVLSYREATLKQSEIERTNTVREKTGVFTGAYAINPVTKKEVPIWISDYVLLSYGTGAIMAVPAHDERDFAFAKQFSLPIIPVLDSETNQNELLQAFTEDGVHIHSGFLDGLNKEDALAKMYAWLEEEKVGRKTVTYKLRDWLVSRQRYWGAPIPIVYCDHCGIVPVKESDLPVILPMDVEFKPDGESPLKRCESFVNTTCPHCHGPAKREVDTLDTFVCSSWYYLRYADAKNTEKPFDSELINSMLPVDMYVGGIEHACMHLLYARFFTKALRDMGYLNFDEPFHSLVHQGLILGPDGEKMSKSKGNTVSPDEYVLEYGADVLRGYLMFGFNYVEGGPWTDDGIRSMYRFYQKVERLVGAISEQVYQINELEKILHMTIRSIRTDIEKFQFNTCIARIMEFTNALVKFEKEGIPRYYIEQLLLLLAPFAPHITEELWELIGNKYSIHEKEYPQFDENMIQESTITIGVQVNGKLRSEVTIMKNEVEEQILNLVKKDEKIQKYLDQGELVKTIVIPNKIVNLIVKER